MAETTSAPSLRELSEAATKGPWYTVDTPWGEGDWIVAGNPDPHAGEFVCLFDGSVIGDDTTDRAAENAAFVARLETDYRAGRLIDPTTLTEAVATARAEGYAAGAMDMRDMAANAINASAYHPFGKEGDALAVATLGIAARMVRTLSLTPGGRTDG